MTCLKQNSGVKAAIATYSSVAKTAGKMINQYSDTSGHTEAQYYLRRTLNDLRCLYIHLFV